MPATIVLKCGGSPLIDVPAVAADVAALVAERKRIVLVHGGAHAVDRLAAELGRSVRRVSSSSGIAGRLTDAAALDTLTLALAGRVKPALVQALRAVGVSAVGLTGLDGGAVGAHPKRALKVVEDGRARVVRDDRSGLVGRVDPRLFTILLDAGYVPVLSPPLDGGEAGPLNADSDRLAAAVAAELDAETFILLTDTSGVLADLEDDASVIRSADAAELLAAAHDRMHVKVLAAREALAGGVANVVIADGRRPRPVLAALAGAGTRVVAREAGAGG